MDTPQPSSYDDLIRPLQDQMLRSIWRITHRAEDAEDALQESLAIVWNRRARIACHPHPQALILRICVNCACDVLRARLRRGSREEPLTDVDGLRAQDSPAGESLDRQELHDVIANALLRLPARQATAVLMRHILDLSYEEIASALGCSESTVRVHVNRANKKLSRLLIQLAPSHCKEKT